MISGVKQGGGTQGSSIVLVLVFTAVCLVVCLGLMGWVSANSRLTQRHCEYSRSTAAAEAATEKVFTAISTDYANKGAGYVLGNMDNYRKMVPTAAESSAWADFTFLDVKGNADRTYVQYTPTTSYKVLSSKYIGLKGFANTIQIISNARDANSTLQVVGAVQQQLELSTIPLYQFAMFFNLDYECNALPPMNVSGPVHCNANIYLTPVSALTFNSDVTASGKILFTPKPGNPLPDMNGVITFNAAHDAGVNTISLPIGTNNSPAAVRQVIEVPPVGESPTSTLGLQRIYNRADMIIITKDTNVVVTSGLGNNFLTAVPWLQATQFINTNAVFFNQREKKQVKATEINIGRLVQWNNTNTLLSAVIPGGNIQTVFVDDQRTMGTNQPGIRLVNGQTLLPKGLTFATPKPLYIQGHFNCPNAAHLGTTNTSATAPASIAADAVTILSTTWDDTKSNGSLGSRGAGDTTVNAALLAGIVQTTAVNGYSGGIENFTRFLEDWTSKTFTYNGSMVVMFDSKVSVAPWVNYGGYYNPPNRNWTFDCNFLDPNKLPPSTPTGATLLRGSWQVARPQSTNIVFTF